MYERILVPTDGSATAAAGLLEACKLAKNQGARLRIIHVVEPLLGVTTDFYGSAYDQIVNGLQAEGAAVLERAASKAREQGVTVETQLIESLGRATGEVVTEEALQWHADLIVLGTHGRRGLRRIVMGSDAEYVVRHSLVPTLLIRHGAASGKT